MTELNRTSGSVRGGDTIPVVERAITMAEVMAYQAATWDWHRMHYDLAYAKKLGFPNVVIDGQMVGALFASVAMRWAGPRAFLESLEFKLKAMAFPDETLRFEGEIGSVTGQGVTLDQRAHCGNRLVAEAVTRLRIPSHET